MSKLTLYFLGDGGGYLSEVEVHGEDERGERGGDEADPERGGDGLGGGGGREDREGGVLTEDEGGVHGDGAGLSGGDVRGGVEAAADRDGVLTEDAMRPSANEKEEQEEARTKGSRLAVLK